MYCTTDLWVSEFVWVNVLMHHTLLYECRFSCIKLKLQSVWMNHLKMTRCSSELPLPNPVTVMRATWTHGGGTNALSWWCRGSCGLQENTGAFWLSNHRPTVSGDISESDEDVWSLNQHISQPILYSLQNLVFRKMTLVRKQDHWPCFCWWAFWEELFLCHLLILFICLVSSLN